MARLKFEMPKKILASVSVPVRITDINYGNHVGNNALVAIIHEARMQFLNQHNFTELNAGGISLIMNELLVEYKNESFYNDLLLIQIFAGNISGVSFELFYKISCNRNDHEIIIAYAKTGMVGYNYDRKKVTAIPETLRSILIS